MIVGTSLTGLGAGGVRINKANLGAQDMLFTLESLPAQVIRPSEQIIGSPEGVVGCVHRCQTGSMLSPSVPAIVPSQCAKPQTVAFCNFWDQSSIPSL